MGGVPGFLCRFIDCCFIANNGGAKKSGALLAGKLENMGGVYAAGIMPFDFLLERQGVRISPDFPGLGRQDAGQGCDFVLAVYCHVFALPKPGFFVPALPVVFTLPLMAAQKGRR
jgi:hypothetical protein